MNTLPVQQRPTFPINTLPSNVNALIRSSIDLRRLYAHAAASSEPGLRLVLSDNAQMLELLIGDLQSRLSASGVVFPVRGSWRGTAHRRLAGWLVHAMPRSGTAWIRLLGHQERALLQAFEVAIAHANPSAQRALRRQLPRLHSIHRDMDILAGARY